MLFTIICTDKPGASGLRSATRADHLAYLKTHVKHVQFAGPMMGANDKPAGSLLIVDVPDRATAEGFAEADPYAKAGLFESVVIRPLFTVFRDGALVE